MGRYILKRLGISIIVFFGITILAYAITSMMPGTPMDFVVASNPNMSAEQIAALTEQYGLDKPLIVQYFSWLWQMLHGNLGYSYQTSQDVFQLIVAKLGPTLLLTVTSMVIALIIAIPLGILAAVKPKSGFDYISSAFAFIGNSLPGFFFGMILILLVSVKLNWLPMSGMYTMPDNHNFADLIRHLILPAFSLSLQQLGYFMRYMRSSMIETLGQDFIRTAKAKGLSRNSIIIKHALRNSINPIIVNIGAQIPFLIGGSVVIESLFSWPGIGKLLTTSIDARDYPVLMGITIFIAVAVLIGNLLVDIVCSLVDPRIRCVSEGGKKSGK